MIISKNPTITIKELSEKIGLSVDGTRYNINKFRKTGLLKREGSTKAGRWIVVEE